MPSSSVPSQLDVDFCQLKRDGDCAGRLVHWHCWVFLAVLTESRGHCTLSPVVPLGRPRLLLSPADAMHLPTTEEN